MSEQNNSEQWKLSGICQFCRRQPYCKTQCKANRTQMKVYAGDMVRQLLADASNLANVPSPLGKGDRETVDEVLPSPMGKVSPKVTDEV